MYRSDSLLIPASSAINRDFYSAASKLSPTSAKMAHLASHHHNGYSFDAHTSPLPRRKQARPRRRSGDSSSTPPMEICRRSTPSPVQDFPEDLSIKKSPYTTMMRQDSDDTNQDSSRGNTPVPTPSLKAESVNSDSVKSDLSLTERNGLFSRGPSAPLLTPPTPTLPTMSALPALPTLTPPNPLAFTSLASLTSSVPSSRSTPVHQADRRKGQHSAPRGGPPRAWTNADLTEALNHVWNRKMTTSQASRVFGIPYNSLLMYVRGKYGKSLKLDTLRKETLEGEAMALAASTRGSYKLAAAAAAAAGATSKDSKGGGSNSNKSSINGDLATKDKSSDKGSDRHSGSHNNNNNNESSKNNNKSTTDAKMLKNNNSAGSHLPLGALNLSGHPLGLPQIGEMDAHALSAQLGLGLGGFGGLTAAGINPYLSYFCDFSFPMSMVGLPGAGGLPPAGSAARHRVSSASDGGLLKKSESRSGSKVGRDDRDELSNVVKRVKTAESPLGVDGHTSGSISSDPEADNKEDSATDEEGPSPSPPAVNLRLGSSLLSSLDLSQTGQV